MKETDPDIPPVNAGKKIAALFVQSDGCYSGLPHVDIWPESRDARKYNGPLPVVAHPPCHLWGNLACVNFARWGGDHNLPGNDGGCFKSALESVKKWGGVLEHPAYSKAFAKYGLTTPNGVGWQASIFGGWVCEVWQSAYGHRANKATWLYYHGGCPPKALNWDRKVGTHQIGRSFGNEKGKLPLSPKESNATPILFRDVLIELAINSNNAERP